MSAERSTHMKAGGATRRYPLKRAMAWLGVVVLAVAGVLGGSRWAFRWLTARVGDSSPDPTVQMKSVRGDGAIGDTSLAAEFAGMRACAACHEAVVQSYLETGHAQTFASTSEQDWLTRFRGTTFVDPERRVTYKYEFDQSGLSVAMPEVKPNARFPLEFAIGSGHHGGVTFLSLLPDTTAGTSGNTQRTIGVEHRISWIGPAKRFGITPGHAGYSVRNPVDWLGAVCSPGVVDACLGCHTTGHHVEDGRLIEVVEDIICERCHGLGADHISAMERGENSLQILHGHFTSAESEIELCGECHRLPKDMQPTELVRTNRELARFQPVALLMSRCFQESDGQLRCTTCHDPHKATEFMTVSESNARCADCHDGVERSQCGSAPGGACIICHMPAIEVNDSMPFHDHWIRVRNEQDPSTSFPGRDR